MPCLSALGGGEDGSAAHQLAWASKQLLAGWLYQMVVFSPGKPGAESWAEALPRWTGRSDFSILHGEISPQSHVLSSLAPSDPVKGMTVLFQTNVVVPVEVVCWSNSLYFWLEIAGKKKPLHTAPNERAVSRAGQQTQCLHIKSWVAYSCLPNLYIFLRLYSRC